MTLQIFRAFPFKAPWCLELFFPPSPASFLLISFSSYSPSTPLSTLISSFYLFPLLLLPLFPLFSSPFPFFASSPLLFLFFSPLSILLSFPLCLSFSPSLSFSPFPSGGLLQEVLWAYASWLWTQESLLTGIWGLYNAVGIELGSTTCNQVF